MKNKNLFIILAVAFVGVGIGFAVKDQIQAEKLLDLCNLGDIKSCDELPEGKYTSVINPTWIKNNRHTKLDGVLSKEQEKYYRDNYVFEKPKKEVKNIDLVRLCEDLIKENLKDPGSYKRLTSRNEQIATGIIRYSGTNSFGGRVQESFKCFDP